MCNYAVCMGADGFLVLNSEEEAVWILSACMSCSFIENISCELLVWFMALISLSVGLRCSLGDGTKYEL